MLCDLENIALFYLINSACENFAKFHILTLDRKGNVITVDWSADCSARVNSFCIGRKEGRSNLDNICLVLSRRK